MRLKNPLIQALNTNWSSWKEVTLRYRWASTAPHFGWCSATSGLPAWLIRNTIYPALRRKSKWRPKEGKRQILVFSWQQILLLSQYLRRHRRMWSIC